MTITPIERLRYSVTSRTGQEPYLVDGGSLRRHGKCNGRCTCQDFQTIYKAIKEFRRIELAGHVGVANVVIGKRWITLGEEGKPFKFVPSDKTRCAHIIAVRAYMFDEFLDRLVTEISKTTDDCKGDEEWD